MSLLQSVRIFRLCVLVTLAVQAAPGHAQPADAFDGSRMQRDLDIMEGVLDKMLGGGQSGHAPFQGNGRVRGVYLVDYGVIMFVDSGDPMAFQFALPDLDFSFSELSGLVDSQVNIVRHETHSLDKENGEDQDHGHRGNVDELKEKITEFLASYGDAIGQLKPEDNITILVKLKERNYRRSDEPASQPLYLQANVSKQNVSKLKRGQLTQAAFSAAVKFNQTGDSGTIGKGLAIMRSILQTSLSHKYNPDFAARQTTAFYLHDAGAIFLIDAGASPFETTFLSQFGEEGAEPTRVRSIKSSGSQSTEAAFGRFEKNLIQLLADYGHTLKFLTPEQKVVVRVERRRPEAKGTTSLLLKLKKADLDAYARGTIQLSELKRRIYSR